MPDVNRLSTEHRKALLGCVKGKANKWRRENPGSDLSQETNQGFFTECSSALGLAKADMKMPDPRQRREAMLRCMNQKANEWVRQNPGKRPTDMTQEMIAANKVECQKALQKLAHCPPEVVRKAAWPECDVDLCSGAPVPLADVYYTYQMCKRGLPEYGGTETLRWSRRVLRAAGLVKAGKSGAVQVPEFVDYFLGPRVLVRLAGEELHKVAADMDTPAVLLPVDEGTLVLTAAPDNVDTQPGELTLDGVNWDEALALGYSTYKMQMMRKAAGPGTVAMDVAAGETMLGS